MSNGISSERQVETAVVKRALIEQTRLPPEDHRRRRSGSRAHGRLRPLSAMIRNRYVDALLAGNALAVHDIESALLGTRSASASPMDARKSTATAITCAPSTRSIIAAASPVQSRAAGYTAESCMSV